LLSLYLGGLLSALSDKKLLELRNDLGVLLDGKAVCELGEEMADRRS